MQLKIKPKGSTNRVGVIKATDGRRLKYRTIWRDDGKQCSKGFEKFEDAVNFRISIEKKLIEEYMKGLESKEGKNNAKNKRYVSKFKKR